MHVHVHTNHRRLNELWSNLRSLHGNSCIRRVCVYWNMLDSQFCDGICYTFVGSDEHFSFHILWTIKHSSEPLCRIHHNYGLIWSKLQHWTIYKQINLRNKKKNLPFSIFLTLNTRLINFFTEMLSHRYINVKIIKLFLFRYYQ